MRRDIFYRPTKNKYSELEIITLVIDDMMSPKKEPHLVYHFP